MSFTFLVHWHGQWPAWWTAGGGGARAGEDYSDLLRDGAERHRSLVSSLVCHDVLPLSLPSSRVGSGGGKCPLR